MSCPECQFWKEKYLEAIKKAEYDQTKLEKESTKRVRECDAPHPGWDR